MAGLKKQRRSNQYARTTDPFSLLTRHWTAQKGGKEGRNSNTNGSRSNLEVLMGRGIRPGKNKMSGPTKLRGQR